MTYEPLEIPQELSQLPSYVQEELAKISLALLADPSYNEAQLKDKTSTINTRLKGEAVRVWSSTLKKPVWSTGRQPTDNWIDGTGAVVYSPV